MGYFFCPTCGALNFTTHHMDKYKRKKHFEYFNSLAYPYVGVTVNVDITDFIEIVQEKKVPFFLSFCYCAARAANCVPQLRQRIVAGKIAEYDSCRTSHTVALADDTYGYCVLDSSMPFAKYLPYAIETQERAKCAKSIEDPVEDINKLIFVSSLLWLSYTDLINPVPIPADSNPRITWGKYFEQNSRILIPVSILCNHALVDGLHIARFYSCLDEQLISVYNGLR